MVIAFASGKGGAGKTTVSLNLTLALPGASYFDLDVEEPDGHIFMKPVIESEEDVTILVPQIREELCTACGLCAKECSFKALVSLKTKPLFFPELCHGCGVCTLVCPEEAIVEVERPMGGIRKGTGSGHPFLEGRLNLKEPMATPVIRWARRHIPAEGVTILDAPPGSSCPMVSSVTESDYVVLVAESTPFGLNDMAIAAETLQKLNLPFGVVINRYGIGDDRVEQYCIEKDIPLLGKIPEMRSLAEAYSRGIPAIEALPELKPLFLSLFEAIKAEMKKGGAEA